ncbi:4Fe-4S binding protein [Desulfocurvus sp. DL9XJH121]
MKHPPDHFPLVLEGPGFTVTACAGASGCPKRALDAPDLPGRIHAALAALPGLGPSQESGPLAAHRVLRVGVSYCPNGCARSHIVDVGLIGACVPGVNTSACTRCGACAGICRERSVILGPQGALEAVDESDCLACGACVRACPTEALTARTTGWRVLAGGKLGRHPRFGSELQGLTATDDAPALVARLVAGHLRLARGHERLGDVVERLGTDALLG